MSFRVQTTHQARYPSIMFAALRRLLRPGDTEASALRSSEMNVVRAAADSVLEGSKPLEANGFEVTLHASGPRHKHGG